MNRLLLSLSLVVMLLFPRTISLYRSSAAVPTRSTVYLCKLLAKTFLSSSSSSSSSSSQSDLLNNVKEQQGVQDLEGIQDSLLRKYGMSSSLALSFFKFAHIKCPDTMAVEVKDMLETKGVLGTVYIAKEGINAAMSIPTKTLCSLKQGFEDIDGTYFSDIRVNLGECMPHNDTQLFKKLIVRSRNQILTDGLPDTLDWTDCGEELPASRWHVELEQDEPLILDCRNTYESDLGTFRNAKPLETDIFSESWKKIDRMLENVSKEKKIMTFCTGGIRCVKVNAYIKQKLGYNNVYRLSDGIISYENWINSDDNVDTEDKMSKFEGTNYLFDGRRRQKQEDLGLGDKGQKSGPESEGREQ